MIRNCALFFLLSVLCIVISILPGCIGGSGTPVISLVKLTPEQMINDARTLLADKEFLTDITEIRSTIRKLEQAEEKAMTVMKRKIYFIKGILQNREAYLLSFRRTEKISKIRELLIKSKENFRRSEQDLHGIPEYHFFAALTYINLIRFGDQQKKDEYFLKGKGHFDLFPIVKKEFDVLKKEQEKKEHGHKSEEFTDFIVGDLSITQNMADIYLCDLYAAYGDLYNTVILMKKLDNTFDFRDPYKYVWMLEKGKLLFHMGKVDAALKTVEPLRSQRHISFIFYPEALWFIEGLYHVKRQYNNAQDVNIRVVRELLTEHGTFYADTSIKKAEEYFGGVDYQQQLYRHAAYEYYKGQLKTACSLIRGIVQNSDKNAVRSDIMMKSKAMYALMLEDDPESSYDEIKKIYKDVCKNYPNSIYARTALFRLKNIDGTLIQSAADDLPVFVWTILTQKKRKLSRKRYPVLNVKVYGKNIVSVTLSFQGERKFKREAEYDSENNIYFFDKIFPSTVLEGEYCVEILNDSGRSSRQYLIISR